MILFKEIDSLMFDRELYYICNANNLELKCTPVYRDYLLTNFDLICIRHGCRMEPNLVFIDGLPEDFDIKIIYDNLPIMKEWEIRPFSSKTKNYPETIKGKPYQLKFLICDFDKKTREYLQFS